jgi:hypothetical protein
VRGAGAVVIESLTADLAARWRAVALGHRAARASGPRFARGAAHDAVLTQLLTECDRAGRRDLGGFVIDAAAPLLARGVAPSPAELDASESLARRGAARLAAGALLRGVRVWADWDREHRGVRFIDDGYAAAQLLLTRFEPIGADGAARASAWLGELAALAPV